MGVWNTFREFFTVDTPDDRPDRLAKLAATVDRGLRSYAEAGKALREIRDRKLFQIVCPTFEDFCQQRWNMSPQHANRLIAAAEVAEDLEPIGSVPRTESQARPLAALPRDQRAAAFQDAISLAGGEPTAEHVAAAVAKRKPGGKPKRLKPITLRVHGARVIVEPGRGFTTVEAALESALAQLRERQAA